LSSWASGFCSSESPLERGEYLLAIKRLREATGIGLKEAKEQIDELRLRRERHA
jgi:hypothetical protein